MHYIGLILGVISTITISISRVVNEEKQNLRNRLVYIGILLAIFALIFQLISSYQNQENLYVTNGYLAQAYNEIDSLGNLTKVLNKRLLLVRDYLNSRNDSNSKKLAVEISSGNIDLKSYMSDTRVFVYDMLPNFRNSLDSTKRTIKHSNDSNYMILNNKLSEISDLIKSNTYEQQRTIRKLTEVNNKYLRIIKILTNKNKFNELDTLFSTYDTDINKQLQDIRERMSKMSNEELGRFADSIISE